MKRLLTLIIPLVLLAACGTGGVSSNPLQPSASGDFSLRVERMDGGGHLAASVEGTRQQPVVVVTAERAEALKGAYFYVEFPGERYHPEAVEFGDFLGGEGETVRLAVTTEATEVPVAIAQVHPDSSSGASGTGVLARVSFATGAAALSKAASQVPGGPENAVKDLTLVPTATEGQYFLTWHEVNVGDYNNDSAVGIQDITPLAVRFGQSVGDGDPQDSWDGIIDGNGDTIINILDVTPMASHFGNSLAGYKVFKNGMATPLPNLLVPSNPISILRPTGYEPKEPVPYTYGAMVVAEGDEYRVACCDAGGETGVLSDPAIYSSGAPPAIPTGLQATTGAHIGEGSVYLSWHANDESDLMGYHLFRRVEGAGTFDQIAALGAYATNYTDSGLAPGTYEYTLSAYNSVLQESEKCEPVSATPYFTPQPPPPDPPTNFQVTNEGIAEGCIKLTWTVSVSDTVDHYEIHRQAPGEPDFSLLTTVPETATEFTDYGLTLGETYAYKMRAVDDWDEVSIFTPEQSTTPSEEPAPPVEITSIATDRYTFNPGENATATLTVTVDPPGTPVTWEAEAGTFPSGTSGTSVTWKPQGITEAQKVIVTATADDGVTQDSDTVKLIVTTMTSKGMGPDFSDWSYYQRTTPYRSLGYYRGSKPVMSLIFMAWW